MTFCLGNTWLVYNNLSLIIAWIRIHCRHFPSLQCDSNHGETKIEGEECGQRRSHLLNLARQLEACSRKDLRVSAEPAPLK